MTLNLAEIRARLEGITPHPWTVKSEWTNKHSGADVVYGATGQMVCQCDEHDGGYGGGQRNVEWIASAPSDIRALLEEVERLRVEVDQLQTLKRAAIAWKRAADDPEAPVWKFTEKLDAAIEALKPNPRAG